MKTNQTILRAKVNKTFLRKSERVFAKLGFSTDTAINAYLARVVERNGIPFELVLGTGADGTFWSDAIRKDALAALDEAR
jgi:addiction module RelB/DinJ family antitoxin